ncbi:hypothetical protein EDC01DRAFT_60861 [Geopyxis carbonaria]|nr:hypothetical protein EDC01DRAFT_60861 [Geopyxis carbonaria]
MFKAIQAKTRGWWRSKISITYSSLLLLCRLIAVHVTEGELAADHSLSVFACLHAFMSHHSPYLPGKTIHVRLRWIFRPPVRVKWGYSGTWVLVIIDGMARRKNRRAVRSRLDGKAYMAKL